MPSIRAYVEEELLTCIPSDWSCERAVSKSLPEAIFRLTSTLVPLICRSLSLGWPGVKLEPPPWLSYSWYIDWSAAATWDGSVPDEFEPDPGSEPGPEFELLDPVLVVVATMGAGVADVAGVAPVDEAAAALAWADVEPPMIVGVTEAGGAGWAALASFASIRSSFASCRASMRWSFAWCRAAWTSCRCSMNADFEPAVFNDRAGGCRRQQEPIVEGFQVEAGLPTGPPIVSKSGQHGCVSLSNPSGPSAVEVSVRRGTNQSGQGPFLGLC